MKTQNLRCWGLLGVLAAFGAGCGNNNDQLLPSGQPGTVPSPIPSVSPSPGNGMSAVPQGTYGKTVTDPGNGDLPAQVQVTADGAMFRHGCNDGEVTSPLMMDSSGRFMADGSLTLFQGSHMDSVPAHFEGTVHGDTITVTTRYTDPSGHSQSFTDTVKLGVQTPPWAC